MPLRKKNSNVKKIIILIVLLVLVALMIISFSPAQNVTEIVLFP